MSLNFISKFNKIIPIASRTVKREQHREEQSIISLLSPIDRPFVTNLCRGIYPLGFDIYLGGDIINYLYSETQSSYNHIDLVSLALNESMRQHLIKMLQRPLTESGSDRWLHFGFTTNGCSKFYSEEINTSADLSIFELIPAIYVQNEIDPSPIKLHLPISLDNYEIVF